MPDETPEQATRRVAEAILAGDYMTPMSEVTPDALFQVMQLGGGMMNLPPPESYELQPLDGAAGTNFRITFKAGDKALSATITWGEVEGSWKIVSITDVVAPAA
jgi:hypothetical protein